MQQAVEDGGRQHRKRARRKRASVPRWERPKEKRRAGLLGRTQPAPEVEKEVMPDSENA